MTVAVSYGAGVNSTALLCGLVERRERPDYVLFADTGGEFEETYRYVKTFSDWLVAQDFPSITRVHRNFERHETLEEECHNLKTLPSKAFGFSGCSIKWKRQPMDSLLRSLLQCQQEWDAGRKIERLIGIDYGEQHRGKIPEDKYFTYRFPLIEWKWDREDCVASILRAGLEAPRKSACWFCPAAKKKEVLVLAANHPDLYARAVAMERNAKPTLTTVKGLGRHWSWEELPSMTAAQLVEAQELASLQGCLCFDGEEVST